MLFNLCKPLHKLNMPWSFAFDTLPQYRCEQKALRMVPTKNKGLLPKVGLHASRKRRS